MTWDFYAEVVGAVLCAGYALKMQIDIAEEKRLNRYYIWLSKQSCKKEINATSLGGRPRKKKPQGLKI